MSFSGMQIPADVGIENANVSIDPAVDEALASNGGSDTVDVVVPANAKYVYIKNHGGLNPASATVNGRTLTVGAEFERDINQGVSVNYTLPSYTVVKNGSLVEVYWEA